jgi:hypothetical protein
VPAGRILPALLVALSLVTARAAVGQTTENAESEAGLRRWLDVQAAQAETRYRVAQNSADVITINQWQHKQFVRAALRFDPPGRYLLTALVATGGRFTRSWDNTGVGTGAPEWTPRVRQLYVSAAPLKSLMVEIGGIAPIRGESTEATTYDNDAYMVGQRAYFKPPEWLRFDQVAVTAGFIGDLTEPNVFERFDGLDDHNYTQVLVGAHLGARTALSADWTSHDGISTIRQAVRLHAPELRIVDQVRFEQYARVEGNEGYGFVAAVEKTVNGRVTTSGGYSDVDEHYGTLLGDRYGVGHRLFSTTNIALTPEWRVQIFYGHGIRNDFPDDSHQRLDVVLIFNALNALRATRQ